MAKKQQAVSLAVEQGLAEDAEQAKRLIMAGLVFALYGDTAQRVEKSGDMLPRDVVLQVQGRERFVSRGAYKLLTALEYFSLSVQGLVCLDAGASTGGFTDCLLQHGAAKVYAVDVGKNQLHEKMRADSRVVSCEGVNLRLAAADFLPEPVDMVVADVSFISLTEILPACMQWLKTGGRVAALIKPQFEVDVHETRKGVVVDPVVRERAVEKVVTFARETLRLRFYGVVPSAIKGPKGNQEFMGVWEKE